MIKKDEKKISSSFEENIAYMDQVLPVKESFDIIKREMEIGGRKSFFYFIDGFVKDEAMLKLMDSFLSDHRRGYAGRCTGIFGERGTLC